MKYILTTILLGSIVFLPSFTHIFLQGSSLALGLILSCILIWLITYKSRILIVYSRSFLLFVFLFLVHFCITLLYHINLITEKHFLSFVMLFFIFISGFLLSEQLKNFDKKKLISAFKINSIFFIFLGFLSLVLEIDLFNYSNLGKPVFPFSEPRHYVTATSGILLATSFYISNFSKILLIGIISLFAFYYQSLLFLVLSLMIIFVQYILDYKRNFFTIFLLLFLIFNIFNLSETGNYFTERLDFSIENSNISSLVYIQGWSDIYYSLSSTNGFGLGFQNMGSLPPSEISELIYNLVAGGKYLNRNDGSFLISKIVSEFGLIGILFVLYYLIQFFKSMFYLKKIIRLKVSPNSHRSVSLVFAHSVIVAFFAEMFFSGAGYFTPGVLLVIVSYFLIQENNRIDNNFVKTR